MHQIAPDERRRRRGLLALAAAALAGLALLALLVAAPAGAQASEDATLSGLELTGYWGEQQPRPAIALRPAFDASTQSYGASTTLTAQVRLRPTANQSGATIAVEGQTVSSGAYSQAFRLTNNEPKRIEVRVTAPDGASERLYAVTVTNNPQAGLRALSLSPLQLHPSVFAASQPEYQAFAAYSVESVRVTATGRYGSETITVNGQEQTSGQASGEIPLSVGGNLITVVATAPDQYTSQRYSITVTRASEEQSSDATLSGISVFKATSFQPDNNNDVAYEGDPLALTPAISSAGREYRALQPEADGYYVAVAVTTNAPGAKSIVITGPRVALEAREPKSRVLSGEASGPWQLDLGQRLITIVVTSLDGTQTQTYRLLVTYGTVDHPSGLRLTPGDGALTVHWAASDAPTAPTNYTFRYRKADETTWLNPAGWSKRKTSYALDAPFGTAADGFLAVDAGLGSHTLRGLENGAEYEVQVRGARIGYLDLSVINWLNSDWLSVTGTAGAARTALAITPDHPSREYGRPPASGEHRHRTPANLAASQTSTTRQPPTQLPRPQSSNETRPANPQAQRLTITEEQPEPVPQAVQQPQGKQSLTLVGFGLAAPAATRRPPTQDQSGKGLFTEAGSPVRVRCEDYHPTSHCNSFRNSR